MSKIGFIGTRHGMSESQKAAFEEFIQSKEFTEFHHGDCIGSDKQAHEIVDHFRKDSQKDIKIIGHPPKSQKTRAYCDFDIEMIPDTFYNRNHHIIEATDIFVANPDVSERVKSGTWDSIRYARRMKKSVYIIHKSGRIEKE